MNKKEKQEQTPNFYAGSDVNKSYVHFNIITNSGSNYKPSVQWVQNKIQNKRLVQQHLVTKDGAAIHFQLL